jgi:hypothetical protein
MRILLDSAHLINILERSRPFGIDELRRILVDGNHKLILTPDSIWEIAAPLIGRHSYQPITFSLNRLEALSPTYLSPTKIPLQELTEAVRAFSTGIEYHEIHPYLPRLDFAIQMYGDPPTHDFINLSMAEIVFNLSRIDPQIFSRRSVETEHLRALLSGDRDFKNPPSLHDHFRTAVRRHLELYRMKPSEIDINSFADWIYEKEIRCPSIRLNYEVFHQMERNRGDIARESDFGDFALIACIPYADAATLDCRMEDYIERATRGYSIALGTILKNDAMDLFAALASA